MNSSFGSPRTEHGNVAKYVIAAILISTVFYSIVRLSSGGSKGWLMHHKDVFVSLNATWMQGEYRGCVADQSSWSRDGKTLERLDCSVEGEGEPKVHELPVIFHGSIEMPDKVSDQAIQVQWRCQRLSDSLNCKLKE